MLQERRQRYMQKLPQITADEHLNKIQGLAQQRETIAAEIRRIEQANDIFALANEDELEIRGILNDIDDRLKRLAGKKDTAAQREKYAFMEGVLYWDIAQDVVPRTWTLKRELKSLDEALAEARSQDASLKDAWSRAPMAFEGFEGRIAGQQKRIDSLRSQVNAARKEQERFIQNLALNEILDYRQRLENYQVRARFALARLYDTIAKEETP
jgi:chromosome segregation ATPase